MSVRLSFSFDAAPIDPLGDCLQLESSVFRMLEALRAQGSIGGAAQVLGLSYRHVWGVLKEQEAVFGGSLMEAEPGRAARLTELGERLLWAERRAVSHLLPEAEAMAARIDTALLLAARPALRRLPLVASHDLLLGVFRDVLSRESDFLLDTRFAGSSEALTALNGGDCVLAGIHLPLEHEHLCQRGSPIQQGIGRLLRLGDHKLVRLARREQGLLVAAGNPRGVRSLADVAALGLDFVNRQAGSGTRLLVEGLLAHHGLPMSALAGFDNVEYTHLAVAAAVAAGLAECGVGLRAAAVRYGLDFVPLVMEDYFLVCRKPFLDSPAMEVLLGVLTGDRFRQRAAAVPGYSTAGAGQVISLRRTLPWYK